MLESARKPKQTGLDTSEVLTSVVILHLQDLLQDLSLLRFDANKTPKSASSNDTFSRLVSKKKSCHAVTQQEANSWTATCTSE